MPINPLKLLNDLPTPKQLLDNLGGVAGVARWSREDMSPREWRLFESGGGNAALREGKSIKQVFRDGRKALAEQQSKRPPHSKETLSQARETAVGNRGNLTRNLGDTVVPRNPLYFEAGGGAAKLADSNLNVQAIEELGKKNLFPNMSELDINRVQKVILGTFKDKGGLDVLKTDPSKLDDMMKGLPDSITQKQIYATLRESNLIVERYNNHMPWSAYAGVQFQISNGKANPAALAAAGVGTVGAIGATAGYINQNNKPKGSQPITQQQEQSQGQSQVPTRPTVSDEVAASDASVFPDERTAEQRKAYEEWERQQEAERNRPVINTTPQLLTQRVNELTPEEIIAQKQQEIEEKEAEVQRWRETVSQATQAPNSTADTSPVTPRTGSRDVIVPGPRTFPTQPASQSPTQVEPERVRDYGSSEKNLRQWALANERMITSVGTQKQRNILKLARSK